MKLWSVFHKLFFVYVEMKSIMKLTFEKISGLCNWHVVVILMQGSFPSPCGAAASGSLLIEEELTKRLKRTSQVKCHFFLFCHFLSIRNVYFSDLHVHFHVGM